MAAQLVKKVVYVDMKALEEGAAVSCWRPVGARTDRKLGLIRECAWRLVPPKSPTAPGPGLPLAPPPKGKGAQIAASPSISLISLSPSAATPGMENCRG